LEDFPKVVTSSVDRPEDLANDPSSSLREGLPLDPERRAFSDGRSGQDRNAPANVLPEPYAALARRIGRATLQKRLIRQATHWAQRGHQGGGIMRLEAILPMDMIVALALRATGLAKRARANYLAPLIVERHWRLPRLPLTFAGFRLLQLSDLHLDLDPAFAPALIEKMRGLTYDAVVITGDFRNSTYENHTLAVAEAGTIIANLREPRFGILGNHDFIEQVTELESLGLPILLNEVTKITRGSDHLWIAGTDDSNFYCTQDLAPVMRALPSAACAVLLSHSPEIVLELPEDRFDLVLCGHTHGGQLCLPGGRWLHVPVRGIKSKFICGPWQVKNTQGYTSPGTGACGVPARLNCAGELTIHVLEPMSS
jgi:predicted MPP superfamily phosphohydrolase